MSKDRLEEALEAMRNESVRPEQLEEARARVWQRLGGQNMTVCSEFQLQFQDYLNGRLDGNRRLLIEDHLSRCSRCRSRLAEQRGGQKHAALPRRQASWWPRWGAWAAAAHHSP